MIPHLPALHNLAPPPTPPGLVVTPFLPGDSLLFATGALAALGSLNLPALLGCYVVAATLGDAVNYASALVLLLLCTGWLAGGVCV